jgi:dihydrofolate synthase/folylpolyglutamate synthase
MKNDAGLTYSAAIEFLYSLRLFGAKFGLENTLKLAALAGNPQEKLRFIHVAGTNGKGSTCAMLESIYRAAGLRTGLFTSPHLVSFRERLQVDRRLISEADVVRLVGEIRPLLQEFPAGHHPTFFEVVTVMALKFFAEQKCDLVIWETGLGGRLDSTNIVTPLASIITNIAFDHQQWLGDTLAKIAAEKAGIIKPAVPVITATDAPEALAVIEKIARGQQSRLIQAGPAESSFHACGAASLSLSGEHQKLNAALALAAVEVLQKQIPVTQAQIHRGLATVNWPGRLQLILRPGGRQILLDGAHNPAGAAALAAALRHNFPAANRTLVLGALADKDWQAVCNILAPLASKILLAPVASERAAAADSLAECCRSANPAAEVQVCTSLAAAMENSAADAFVVITGSLYLVGEALELLDAGQGGPGIERGLNEWRAAH